MKLATTFFHLQRSYNIFKNVRFFPIPNRNELFVRYISSSTVSSSGQDLQKPETNITYSKPIDIEEHLPSTESSNMMGNVMSTADVLRAVSGLDSKPQLHDLVNAFEMLYKLQRSDITGRAKKQIIESAEFNNLCHVVKNNIRFVRGSQAVVILKVLSKLGVKFNSVISQMLLQIISKEINDLTVSELQFLAFLLNNADSNPLVDALKIACPIVFEAVVRIKVDDANIYTSVSALSYAARLNLSDSCLEYLLKCVMKRKSDLTGRLAFNTASACTFLFKLRNPSVRELYAHCISIVTNNIHEINAKDMSHLLNRICSALNHNNIYIDSEKFIARCILYQIQNNINLEDGCKILRPLTKLSYVSTELLDHFDDYLYKIKDSEEHLHLSFILPYIGSCANACYIPPNWKSYEKNIINDIEQNMGTMELPWLKIILNLTILDCWPSSLIEHVFSNNFLQVFLSRENNLLDYLLLLKLYQFVVTLKPGEFDYCLPPEETIKHAISENESNMDEFPLYGALCEGFGSPSYVVSGALTKLGHFLDHVIVVGEDGKVLKINNTISKSLNSRICVDDIDVPENGKLLAILVMEPSCYTLNEGQLKGMLKLMIKSIEQMGLTVVPVSYAAWNDLLDYEKIPFLMKEIVDNAVKDNKTFCLKQDQK